MVCGGVVCGVGAELSLHTRQRTLAVPMCLALLISTLYLVLSMGSGRREEEANPAPEDSNWKGTADRGQRGQLEHQGTEHPTEEAMS